jgi:hypothetical protein
MLKEECMKNNRLISEEIRNFIKMSYRNNEPITAIMRNVLRKFGIVMSYNEVQFICAKVNEKIATNFKVRGCIAIPEENANSVGRCNTTIENVMFDNAEFFGVYEVIDNGEESWIADFYKYDDAVMFALEKEKRSQNAD